MKICTVLFFALVSAPCVLGNIFTSFQLKTIPGVTYGFALPPVDQSQITSREFIANITAPFSLEYPSQSFGTFMKKMNTSSALALGVDEIIHVLPSVPFPLSSMFKQVSVPGPNATLIPDKATEEFPKITALQQTILGPQIVSYIFRCQTCDKIVDTTKKSTIQVLQSSTPLEYLDPLNQTARIYIGNAQQETFDFDPNSARISRAEYTNFLTQGGVV
ncbi:hypothetical protein M422DRAFT_67946 [Sphaerobolus stellatus SS14]|uniref:Uncharacterized protein n=1 Tax=Sphaerobolus stellatus (strain SS14) TaxID=990650 RepID=A0A0C9UIZ3_SPHS4|nr:hypothetical protein M422DRAFT_67946 [Sphaerobolus stellatus SS14]